MLTGQLRAFALLISLAICATSCASVPAYERGRLAHPTMSTDDGVSPGLQHVRAVQEGATGGEVGASSGCGCN